jgi:hypothetical protein
MKLALALGAALLTLTACGTETGSSGTDDTAGDDPKPTASTPAGTTPPATVPAAKGTVTGQGTVMDTGRPELCLGAVAESYPPQCSGLPIVGWDWAKVAGQFEKSGNTRWGSFVLTGTFDGTTFTMTKPAQSLATYDPMPDPGYDPDPFKTPCAEPDGGWAVVDPATTNEQTMQRVFEKASQLDGYAGAWMDQSPHPSTDEGDMNDPARLIVNVTVTGDVEAAEAELRKIWGGALCVTRAKYTEAELQNLQTQLQKVPGLLTSSAQNDLVTAEVIHDDGTIQAWADQEYGAGRVVFSSALKPA